MFPVLQMQEFPMAVKRVHTPSVCVCIVGGYNYATYWYDFNLR
ncbi:hypothetical protein NC651_039276 [Populus alba x Populus x berolinensis]|nr:hypothetical protein NC651_039276 [Populus alba x Populus x berolinensis]